MHTFGVQAAAVVVYVVVLHGPSVAVNLGQVVSVPLKSAQVFG